MVLTQLMQGSESGLRGLVVRHLPDGETYWYNSSEAQVPLGLLDGSHSLSLRDLTCADGGRYTCHLSAPVGQQNRKAEVLLRLTGERGAQASASPAPLPEGLTLDCFQAVRRSNRPRSTPSGPWFPSLRSSLPS